MKRLIWLVLLIPLTGCDAWKKLTGTNDTIINTVTPGAGIIQHRTLEFHAGLSIMSTDRDYHATPTQIRFVPLSSTSHITIRATGTGMVKARMPESPVDITLTRNGQDILSSESGNTRAYRLLSGALDFNFDPTYGMVDVQAPVSLEFTEDSPGAGSSLVYAVAIRTGDAPPLPNSPPTYNARWCTTGGTELYSAITIEEWQD